MSVDSPIVRPPGIYSYLLNARSLFDIDSSSVVCPFHFRCAQIHGHVDLSFSGASFGPCRRHGGRWPRYRCTERVEPSILGDRQSGLGISLLWVRRLFARPYFWSLFRCFCVREASGSRWVSFVPVLPGWRSEHVPFFV